MLKDKSTVFVIAYVIPIYDAFVKRLHASLALLRERFVNLPPQIAVGLYQALHGDLATAVEEVRRAGILLSHLDHSCAVKGSITAPKSVVMVVKGWKPKGEADPKQQVERLETRDWEVHYSAHEWLGFATNL